MTTSNPSLEALAKVLNEFFSSATSSDKRIQLQSYLDNFQKQPNACHTAVQYLHSTPKDPTVILFCLNILENTITQKWPLSQSSLKQQIYAFVITSLDSRTTTSTDHNDTDQNYNFITKKLAQLLALLACYDWPTEFPHYFDLIKSRLVNSTFDLKMSTIGLFCLQSAYEQLTNPPELIDHTKKLELKHGLTNQSFEFMDILARLALQLGHTNLLQLAKNLLYHPPTTSFQSDELLTNLWDLLFEYLEHLIKDCVSAKGLKSYCLINLLQCFEEVFKFCTNKNSLSDDLPIILFILSLIGTPQCLSVCLKSESSLIWTNQKYGSYIKQISLLALNCIQCLIEQKDLRSTNSIECLLILFRMIQYHLAMITGFIVPGKSTTSSITSASTTTVTTTTIPNSTSHYISDGNIANTLAIDAEKQSNHADYLLKLVDILRCLIPHICHLDGYNLFDFHSFLQLVENLTFSIKDLDIYFNYLQLWSQFFESIHIKYSTSNPISNSIHQSIILPDYLQTILCLFGKSLLSKLFYNENANFLDSLDEDVLDDFPNCSTIPEISYLSTTPSSHVSFVFDPTRQQFKESVHSSKISPDPCEYRLFLRESLLTFHSLADLIPSYFINLILERFQSTWTDYMSFINSTGLLSSHSFAIPKNQPLHRMHWILRDYATCLQILGFIVDILRFVNCPMTGRDILQVLVQSLQLNMTILPILPTIEERLIKYSLIEVIVQTILILHAFLISERLNCSVENSNLPDKITLTLDERDHFLTELFVIFERLLLPLDGSPSSNSFLCSSSSSLSPRIRFSAALLFKSLITSPQRDICPSPHLILQCSNGHKSNILASTVFDRIFTTVCQSRVDATTDIHIIRLLVCALTCYFSLNQDDPDSHVKTIQTTHSTQSRKSNLLNQLIIEFFLPYLNWDYFNQNQTNHFIYLGLLNDAILSLENTTNTARQILLGALTNSGLIHKLVDCLMHILTKSDLSNLVQIQCSTIYLTFFTTFIRILSYSDSVMSDIVQLFGQIIRTLRSSSTTTITPPVTAAVNSPNSVTMLPLQVVEHLLDMLILISQNRRIFIPLLADIVELCCHSFLPILASIPGAYYQDDQSIISLLVCNACLNNPSVSQLFYEILFSSLSNGFVFFFGPNSNSDLFVPVQKRYTLKQPEVFHRILILMLTILHPDQVNSSLVRFLIENLINLNRLRKLFDIPEFNQPWLPQFMSCLLDYLLDSKHPSCQDIILLGLHQLTLSLKSNESDPNISQQFVQFFLPIYLEHLNQLDHSQRVLLLSLFTNTDKQDQLNSLTMNLVNLEDLDIFSLKIEQFLNGIRFYRKMNSEFNDSNSTSDTNMILTMTTSAVS